MNKEDRFLASLLQELPRQKAPEGITQLIMQKIAVQTCPEFQIPKLRFWQTEAFYILLSLCLLEGYLLWSKWAYFTTENLKGLLQNAYALTIQKLIVEKDLLSLIMLVSFLSLVVYLFVKERIEADRNQFRRLYI